MIPNPLRQNETRTWHVAPFYDGDARVSLTSSQYTLQFVLAGPSTSAVTLSTTSEGSGWLASINATQAAQLIAGTYWWQAILTATGYRRVIDEGEVKVEADLAAVTSPYDGRTQAEKALADCKTALAVFQASGGRIKSYTIGDRTMQFQDEDKLLQLVDFWQAQVIRERNAADCGKSRHIFVRFDRP